MTITSRVSRMPTAGFSNILRRIPTAAPPVLNWDDDATDTTPDFTVDLDDESVVAGAVLTLQIEQQVFTHVLTSAEILSGDITMSGAALANGTYRVRIKISGAPWSDIETITIAA